MIFYVKCAEAAWNYKAGGIVHLQSTWQSQRSGRMKMATPTFWVKVKRLLYRKYVASLAKKKKKNHISLDKMISYFVVEIMQWNNVYQSLSKILIYACQTRVSTLKYFLQHRQLLAKVRSHRQWRRTHFE